MNEEQTIADVIARRCPVCGNPVSGRIDKIFCSNKCRNAYHYDAEFGNNSARRSVIGILDRNYRLLNRCLAYGMTSVPLDHLVADGFDRRYSTGIRKGHRGHTEHICYDICYCVAASRVYRISRIDWK